MVRSHRKNVRRLRRRTGITVPLLALTALSLTGCRGPGDLDALESELRYRSEENTQLKLVIHDLEVELRECRRRLGQQSISPDDPERERNGTQNGQAPPIPKIELGPPKQNTNGDTDNGGPAPRFDPRPPLPGSAPGRSNGPKSSRAAADRRVVQITLDPASTGGWDADPMQPGDEGLLVVIEPRNASGEVVPVAGSIAVAAYDAELLERFNGDPRRGRLAHIGTWHFSVKDAATWFLHDRDGAKMHFQLRWPEERPTGRHVRIYARYTTDEGQHLQSNWSVVVNHNGVREAETAASAGAPASGDSSLGAALRRESDDNRSIPPARRSAHIRPPEWKPYR